MSNNVNAARVIADFNKGKIDAKRAAKLIKRASASKGKSKSRRDWK